MIFFLTVMREQPSWALASRKRFGEINFPLKMPHRHCSLGFACVRGAKWPCFSIQNCSFMFLSSDMCLYCHASVFVCARMRKKPCSCVDSKLVGRFRSGSAGFWVTSPAANQETLPSKQECLQQLFNIFKQGSPSVFPELRFIFFLMIHLAACLS